MKELLGKGVKKYPVLGLSWLIHRRNVLASTEQQVLARHQRAPPFCMRAGTMELEGAGAWRRRRGTLPREDVRRHAQLPARLGPGSLADVLRRLVPGVSCANLAHPIINTDAWMRLMTGAVVLSQSSTRQVACVPVPAAGATSYHDAVWSPSHDPYGARSVSRLDMVC